MLNPQAFAADGDNRLLWRMNPRRLDVEAWRDALLSATGELDESVGGASVSNITKSPRRTLYAAISRSGEEFKSDTFLRLFDFPQSRSTSEGRTVEHRAAAVAVSAEQPVHGGASPRAG